MSACFLDADALLEEAQPTLADAKDAIDAAVVFIGAGLAGATAGGVLLGAGDVRAITTILRIVQERVAAAQEAVGTVALARLQGEDWSVNDTARRHVEGGLE